MECLQISFEFSLNSSQLIQFHFPWKQNVRFSDIFLRRNKLIGLNQFILFFKEPVKFDLSLAVLRIFMIFRVDFS